MTTWREEILLVMKHNEDSFDNIEGITLSDDELDEPFDNGYGGTEGKPFTAWTKQYIYFPMCYDGAEWVGCVSRNPNGKPTEHQGGG